MTYLPRSLPSGTAAAHRPLGSVMPARLQVDEAISAFRHRENATPEQNPAAIDQIPA